MKKSRKKKKKEKKEHHGNHIIPRSTECVEIHDNKSIIMPPMSITVLLE